MFHRQYPADVTFYLQTERERGAGRQADLKPTDSPLIISHPRHQRCVRLSRFLRAPKARRVSANISNVSSFQRTGTGLSARSFRGSGKTMLGAYTGEWPKAASTGGGAAGPAIDRVKSTTSHYSSTTLPRPLPPHTAVLRDSLPPSGRCCCCCCSPIPLSTLVLVVLSYGRTG